MSPVNPHLAASCFRAPQVELTLSTFIKSTIDSRQLSFSPRILTASSNTVGTSTARVCCDSENRNVLLPVGYTGWQLDCDGADPYGIMERSSIQNFQRVTETDCTLSTGRFYAVAYVDSIELTVASVIALDCCSPICTWKSDRGQVSLMFNAVLNPTHQSCSFAARYDDYNIHRHRWTNHRTRLKAGLLYIAL